MKENVMHRITRGIRTAGLAAVALLGLMVLAGCQSYEIEVRLDPDGGGHRSTLLTGDPGGPDEEAAAGDIRGAFTLLADEGWRRLPAEDEGRKLRFLRERDIPAPELWHEAAEIRIPGNPDHPQNGVLLSNTITVTKGSDSGVPTLTYTEQWRWMGVMEAFGALVAELLVDELAVAWPGLSAVERAELRGLVEGAVQRHVSLEAVDDEDAEYDHFLDILANQLHAVIARTRLGADRDALRAIVEEVYRGDNERGDAMLDNELPGLSAVFTTDLELAVTMPGPILGGNADRVEGNTAYWKLDLQDTILAPITAEVRSANTK